MPTIASFEVSDPPELWARLGFRVSNGVVAVGGTEYRLGRRGSGIARWSLVDVDLGPGAGDVDGLPTAAPDLPTPGEDPPARHPNGVTGLDHVVVATPDHGRTVAAFEAIGLELRRVRATAGHGAPMRQAFFRLGPVILEVVGPDEPAGDGPAQFFGLAWTCVSLGATGALLGPSLGPAKPAVQRGRHIATLAAQAESGVAMAFMSAPARAPTNT